jgi:AmmeMemoRadiSam system protein A
MADYHASTVMPPQANAYCPEERVTLLGLARSALAHRAAGSESEPQLESVSDHLQEVRACFVTLFKNGDLRGCIGQVYPRMPLCQAVAKNASSAGFNDLRFESVSAEEIPQLTIEISVLSIPVVLTGAPELNLARLRPGIDGVVLERDGSTVTFLPQVWEHIPDPVQFLQRLCEKAGWDKNCWRDPDTRISVYQVESFESGESSS